MPLLGVSQRWGSCETNLQEVRHAVPRSFILALTAVRGDFNPDQCAERQFYLRCATRRIRRLKRVGVYAIHRVEIPYIGQEYGCAHHVRQREPELVQNIANDLQATGGLRRDVTLDDAARHRVARDLSSEEGEIPSHNSMGIGTVGGGDVCVRESIVFHGFFNCIRSSERGGRLTFELARLRRLTKPTVAGRVK